MKDLYQELGVSASKHEVHHAIKCLPTSAFPGAFCFLSADPLDPAIVHAMHADGAGTKANVAYIAFRETGSPQWFRTIAQDSVVMNLDDLVCIGLTNNFILSNTIGRNATIIPGSVLSSLLEGYQTFVSEMSAQGIQIIMAGGETADSGDTVRTLVVDSTLYGRMPRSKVIDFSRVQPGNCIIGFSSVGQTTYETHENSGIGSNGFTLARHVLLSKEYRDRYPESFAPELPKNSVYRGKYLISDKLPNSDLTVGEALLSPTRTYAPVVNKLLTENFEAINGIIHNTGGGLTKCQKFGNSVEYFKEDLLSMPPIFSLIADEGNLDDRTMFSTFNCGQRLEVFCDPRHAEWVLKVAADFGVAAKVIGAVRASADGQNRVFVRKANGEFERFE